MFPRVLIDLEKYRHNVTEMKALCQKHGMSLMAVTKVFCADEKLISILNQVNVDYIADSRLMNLDKIVSDIPKVLLRIPSIHEIDHVVKTVSISLNSELATIKALNDSAKQQGCNHKILLMIDLGDLREGFYYTDNILSVVQEIITYGNITLLGLGTNLTCYGGIIPDPKTLNKLVGLVELIQQHFGLRLEIISGGNSSHLHLLYKDINIPYVNNLRLGESLILGRETAYGNPLPDMSQDVLILEADLVEIKDKPSAPEGMIGMDAFGKEPTYEDVGIMKRGILAIGKQDVDYRELIPLDHSIKLIGTSSDHIIVDLTNSKKTYHIGDVLTFKLTYGSALSLMTSRYVRKVYV